MDEVVLTQLHMMRRHRGDTALVAKLCAFMARTPRKHRNAKLGAVQFEAFLMRYDGDAARQCVRFREWPMCHASGECSVLALGCT